MGSRGPLMPCPGVERRDEVIGEVHLVDDHVFGAALLPAVRRAPSSVGAAAGCSAHRPAFDSLSARDFLSGDLFFEKKSSHQ
jgi:hypothetical protein